MKNPSPNVRTKRLTLSLLIAFLLGLGGGFFAHRFRQSSGPTSPRTTPGIQRLTGYNYVNPLLDCGVEFIEITPFQKKVQDYLDARRGDGTLSDAAIYFRHLNNGRWFGINSNAKFWPASLLKVPVMMTILKQAETDPSLFDKQIPFLGSRSVLPKFETGPPLVPGESYSVEDLLRRMITESSNDASSVLFDILDVKTYKNVFNDLGIVSDRTQDLQDASFMTVNQYATFFRVLYNGSYLNRDMSEFALSLLAHSEFDYGIRGGVRDKTTVANKFGTREHLGSSQLHDCGIVYYPGQPYILCMMTRGPDENRLSAIIQSVSRIVFDEMSSQIETEQP